MSQAPHVSPPAITSVPTPSPGELPSLPGDLPAPSRQGTSGDAPGLPAKFPAGDRIVSIPSLSPGEPSPAVPLERPHGSDASLAVHP